LLASALLPLLGECAERRQCPECVARIVGIALARLSAWHIAYSVSLFVDRDRFVDLFLEYVRALIDQYVKEQDDERGPTAMGSVTRGIH